LLLAAALAACKPLTAQQQASSMIQNCAADAGQYIDPQWGPRQATGTYPSTNGIDVVIHAQGGEVTASCSAATGYYTTMEAGLDTVQGVEPEPGQLYLPAQHRWLTDAELHARMASLMAPRPAEYAGASWTPNPPGDYRFSDLAKVASTDCFSLQSTLEPTRQLVACQVAAGHRYWVSQGLMSLALASPPPGLAPIPPAPPTDWSTQPGGAPPH
jgi:hypothetical protein